MNFHDIVSSDPIITLALSLPATKTLVVKASKAFFLLEPPHLSALKDASVQGIFFKSFLWLRAFLLCASSSQQTLLSLCLQKGKRLVAFHRLSFSGFLPHYWPWTRQSFEEHSLVPLRSHFFKLPLSKKLIHVRSTDVIIMYLFPPQRFKIPLCMNWLSLERNSLFWALTEGVWTEPFQLADLHFVKWWSLTADSI